MSVGKTVRPEAAPDGAAVADCPACGHAFRFRYLPLFTLEGVPAVGKSTTAGLIDGEVSLALYEGDQTVDLVAGELDWGRICELNFRIGMTLHASGRQAMYVGGVHPHDPGESPETRYFPALERCGLVCSDDDLEARLHAREWFRDRPERVHAHLEHNRWIREDGEDAGIHVLNTTDLDPETVARRVVAWVEESLDR